MTNKEAAKILSQYDVSAINFFWVDGEEIPFSDWSDAIEMAISALAAQDVPDTYVGDMVSRNAVEHLIMTRTYDLGNPIQKGLMMNALQKLPSAQPEVIRCKDCKNWKRQVVSINDGVGSCSFHEASFVSYDGYCYWAERREDGQAT